MAFRLVKNWTVLQIFHPGRPSGGDDPVSWTEPYFHPDETFWKSRTNDTWFAAADDEVSKHLLPDMQTANAAVKMLKKFAATANPFFLAVGFLKPHLPFVFPKHYLDMYPPEAVHLPSNPFAPNGMPEVKIISLELENILWEYSMYICPVAFLSTSTQSSSLTNSLFMIQLFFVLISNKQIDWLIDWLIDWSRFRLDRLRGYFA